MLNEQQVAGCWRQLQLHSKHLIIVTVSQILCCCSF